MTISVSAVYPSPWISPDDIKGPTTVLVSAVTVEEFRLPDGTKQLKIVLAFAKAKKRLPLNKTQAKALAGLLGDDAEKWCGRTLILAPAIAPNRKGTIALGVPKVAAQQAAPAEPIAEADSAGRCETCGSAGAHHPDCPEA